MTYPSSTKTNGGKVLFVGTKDASREAITVAAARCGMPYVNDVWKEGMLAHFKTDAIFIADVDKDNYAIQEAYAEGIPIIAIVDTNSDPELVDHVIACNDDAHRAINVIAMALADAILEAKVS